MSESARAFSSVPLFLFFKYVLVMKLERPLSKRPSVAVESSEANRRIDMKREKLLGMPANELRDFEEALQSAGLAAHEAHSLRYNRSYTRDMEYWLRYMRFFGQFEYDREEYDHSLSSFKFDNLFAQSIWVDLVQRGILGGKTEKVKGRRYVGVEEIDNSSWSNYNRLPWPEPIARELVTNHMMIWLTPTASPVINMVTNWEKVCRQFRVQLGGFLPGMERNLHEGMTSFLSRFICLPGWRAIRIYPIEGEGREDFHPLPSMVNTPADVAKFLDSLFRKSDDEIEGCYRLASFREIILANFFHYLKHGAWWTDKWLADFEETGRGQVDRLWMFKGNDGGDFSIISVDRPEDMPEPGTWTLALSRIPGI